MEVQNKAPSSESTFKTYWLIGDVKIPNQLRRLGPTWRSLITVGWVGSAVTMLLSGLLSASDRFELLFPVRAASYFFILLTLLAFIKCYKSIRICKYKAEVQGMSALLNISNYIVGHKLVCTVLRKEGKSKHPCGYRIACKTNTIGIVTLIVSEAVYNSVKDEEPILFCW